MKSIGTKKWIDHDYYNDIERSIEACQNARNGDERKTIFIIASHFSSGKIVMYMYIYFYINLFVIRLI